ncbi:MAG: metallophosphoesterase [Balneolaceae bacterium]
MKHSLLCLLLFALSFSNIQAQSEDDSGMRIVLMADLNESYGSTHYGEYVDSAIVWVEKWQPDFILFAGDMIAGQNLALSEEEIRAMWGGFDQTIGQPLHEMKIPFAFTLGNHDGSGSGNFDHERELAKEYWSPHKPVLNYVSNEHFPFYYSFEFEDLFVISWDASYYKITEAEIGWIEQQLSQKVAKKASKRIMLGHLPLYAVAEGRNREGEILKDADELFDIMKRNNVDYYFSGHHHAWYAAEKNGLKMIHSGAQGSGPRPLIGSDLPPRRTITLLERKIGSSTFNITTFDMENNMKVISPEELPSVIEGINGRIERYNYQE